MTHTDHHTEDSMYQRNGVYWLRVRTPLGAARRVSTETRHQATAERVGAWADDVRERLDRFGVLAAIVRGDLTLPEAYVLGEQDAAVLVAERAQAAADPEVTTADVDQWQRWVVAQGAREASAADYRRQVETVWPAPRMQSWLQPRTILTALDALPVSEPTKARYRAALSSLCQWLVRVGRLDVNPMPSVPGFSQSAPRALWYSDTDALRLLEALPVTQRAAEAVMWACGWEWAAVERAVAGDLDLTAMTAFARGTKTPTRQRLTVITRPEVRGWLEDALRHKLPAASVWGHLRNDRTLKVHQGVCRDLGLPVTTLHDWRHTFAVSQLRAGRSIQFVAQMLGHANTTLVQTRYGRYVLSAGELEAVAAQIRHTA